jgi:hypothetical protein
MELLVLRENLLKNILELNMIELAEDNRTEVALDLTDAELLVLFKMAHEKDMTFNNFVEQVLRDFLEQLEYDNVLNELDGTSEHGVVQSSWPYPEAD